MTGTAAQQFGPESMLVRLSKTALVAAVALYMLIVALNNFVDYDSNFDFVKHVLAMDTTFPGNKLKWRALSNGSIHHLFYWMIILWESLSAVFIGWAAIQLWRARKASAGEFRRAKSWASTALVFNLLLWFVAFTTVGGEWFVMWQSHTWNGQEAAFRVFTSVLLVVLYLGQPEAETESETP